MVCLVTHNGWAFKSSFCHSFKKTEMSVLRFPPIALALMMACGTSVACAQASTGFVSSNGVQAAPFQVVHLSASAQTEVAQDWLVMTLSVQKEGLQAPAVQKHLNALLARALALGTPMAKPGALEVSTGEMNVSPRHGRDGKISAWSGTAQLILQGRDAVQLASLAARLPEWVVSQMDWRLSPEQKLAAELRIQAEAVERFKSNAQALAQQFGFAAYTLKEVRVNSPELGESVAMPRMAMAQMDATAAAPATTAAGKTRVVVNVSGSIQLR